MVHPSIDPNLRDLNHWINNSEHILSPYILNATICASRNLYGYPMVISAKRKEKRSINFVMKSAFHKKNKELKGCYYTLGELSQNEKIILESDPGSHFLPPGLPAGSQRFRDGNDGRGYFEGDDKKIFAWVNQEDHLKLYVRDMGVTQGLSRGVDLKLMIKEWARALVLIENVIEPSGFCFMHSERLGYVTSCPSNLGTAMRMTVTLRLNALALTYTDAITMGVELNIILTKLENEGNNIWELTNTVVLGYTEVEILENFFFGLMTIIALEIKATPGPIIVPAPVPVPVPVVVRAPAPVPVPVPVPAPVIDYSIYTDLELIYIKGNNTDKVSTYVPSTATAFNTFRNHILLETFICLSLSLTHKHTHK